MEKLGEGFRGGVRRTRLIPAYLLSSLRLLFANWVQFFLPQIVILRIEGLGELRVQGWRSWPMLLSMLTRYCFRLFTLHEEPLRLGLLHPFGARKQAQHLLPKLTQPGGGWVLVLLDSMVQAIGTSGLALGSRKCISSWSDGLIAQ